MKVSYGKEGDRRLVLGMMSGTSADGIDAAIVEFTGSFESPEIKLLAFESGQYPPKVREQVFELFEPEKSTVRKIGYMNFLIGEIFAETALKVIEKAGLKPEDIDLIGSHGQTIWHSPEPDNKDGYPIMYTMQIGEGAVIAERTGIPTLSDYRVADMAAGGQAAPLASFSEYHIYRRENETILLQNVGGIGNVTVMPAKAKEEDVYAFDTGPGNLLIDGVVEALTNGEKTYDKDGAWGAQGKVNEELLNYLKDEPYYDMPLPKTTGRELYNSDYTRKILQWYKENPIAEADLVATVTDLTAWSIVDAYEKYILPRYKATMIVIGGGGGYNKTFLKLLAERFAQHGVKVATQEDLGWSSDAKEAVAFALMADKYVGGLANTLPSVTGARRAVVMGKLSRV